MMHLHGEGVMKYSIFQRMLVGKIVYNEAVVKARANNLRHHTEKPQEEEGIA